MADILFYLAIAGCAVTAVILAIGVGGFGSGKITPRGQNRVMRLRIIAQFIAVVLILLTAWALRG